jgi:acetylornithine deacetylase/succinyl-diaminopimelate desuccinylase-like protein
MGDMNRTEIGRETSEILQNLIRFDTTNPPGNESPCAVYVAETLRGGGYDPVFLESAPGRGNVVARYRGSGEKKPLLIYGHTDVVAVEEAKWSHQPFGGQVDDGCVWGRGALDMKDMVSYEIETMLLLAREKVPLKRDVIFAATADEEAGGQMGAGWLVENHRELIEAEYGLSEGAGASMLINGHKLFGVRTAEKGTSRFTMRATGSPGHGSVPKTETAVHRIAHAVDALYANRLPLHLTETTRRLMEVLASIVGVEWSSSPDEKAIDELASKLPSDIGRALQAVVRNTAVPTGLAAAGGSINVIPSLAEARVDGRIVPGQTPEEFFDEVRTIVGKDIEIEAIDRGLPQESSPGDVLYQAIESALADRAPDAKLVPTMLSGATDARWVSRMGTKCLGFSPLALPQSFSSESLVHGHDERVPLSALEFGIEVFYKLVKDFAAT